MCKNKAPIKSINTRAHDDIKTIEETKTIKLSAEAKNALRSKIHLVRLVRILNGNDMVWEASSQEQRILAAKELMYRGYKLV